MSRNLTITKTGKQNTATPTADDSGDDSTWTPKVVLSSFGLNSPETHQMRPPQGGRLARPLESIGQVLSKKDSSLSCSDCSLDLKMFNDWDSTIDGSSRFQMLMILSLKKCCRKSVDARLLFNLKQWPLVRPVLSSSKNVLMSTIDIPWNILKTSIRSARTLRCSNFQRP